MNNIKRIGLVLVVLAAATQFTHAKETKEAKEERPDATLDLSGGSFAAGIGFNWGKGTLTHKGKEYPISVSGMSLGKVGLTSVTARGNVYNLERLKDFDGNYTSTGVGMTLAAGRSAVAMKNQHDVKVAVYSTNKGVDVTIGGAGVDMHLKK